MARIPQFQRSQLASSLVGTPGVDTSVVQTAQAFQPVFDVVRQEAGARLLKQKQAQETTEANKLLLDFELGAETDFETHKRTHANDPTQKTELLREQFNDRLNTMTENIESDGVRQAVSGMAQSVIRNKSLKELKWAQGQRAVVSFNNLTQSVDLLAQQAKLAGQAQDTDRFGELLRGIPGTLVAGATVLSGEQQAKLNEGAPKAVASGFLYGMSDEHPETALTLIREGFFDEVLSPKELNQFRNDAEARVKKLAEILDFQVLSDGIDENTGMWDAFREGDLTVDQIDEQEPTPFNQMMREMVLKTNPATMEQKASTEVKLWNRYSELLKKKRGKVKAVGQLEDLLRFQEEIMTAAQKGEITQQRVNTFMKDLSVPLSKAAKQAAGEKTLFGGEFKNPFEKGIDVVNDWLKTQGQDKDAETKVRMLGSLVEEMDKVGAFDANEGTMTVDDVADLVIEKEKDLRFPDRRLFRKNKIGEKMTVFGIPVIFMGFAESGEPNFNEDPDANAQ